MAETIELVEDPHAGQGDGWLVASAEDDRRLWRLAGHGGGIWRVWIHAREVLAGKADLLFRTDVPRGVAPERDPEGVLGLILLDLGGPFPYWTGEAVEDDCFLGEMFDTCLNPLEWQILRKAREHGVAVRFRSSLIR